MPPHKRTISRGRDRGRDRVIRSLASSATSGVTSGVTSLANKTINKPMNRGRRSRRLNKGKYVATASRYAIESLRNASKMLGQKAFKHGNRLAIGAHGYASEIINAQIVPTVPDKGCWAEFKVALEIALKNIDELEPDGEINPPTYWQSVRDFLDKHKNPRGINKITINKKTATLRGIDPENQADATPGVLKQIFIEGKGITADSIINSLEYLFINYLVSGLGLEPEPEEPGKGFQLAKERTATKNNTARIVKLANDIETFMRTPPGDRKKYYDTLISKSYNEINSLIREEDDIKILFELNEKYPVLKKYEEKSLDGALDEAFGRLRLGDGQHNSVAAAAMLELSSHPHPANDGALGRIKKNEKNRRKKKQTKRRKKK